MAKSLRVPKRNGLRYFFLNGQHHKVLRISRAEDLITAWNFVTNKTQTYVWSATQKKMQRAFTMRQVSKMFDRDVLVIHEYIKSGKIKRPAQAKFLNGSDKPGKFLFSEDDLRDLHSYLLTVHRGRPRKDGKITPSKLMSRAELEAMMKEEKILYTKDASGQYVPVWKQPDW